MRRASAPLAALGLGLALVVVPALPASAHNAVVSSTPEEGETLTEVPEFFVVTTNEAMLDVGGEGAGFAIQVTDESGLYYGDGCVDVGGPSMSTPAALGEAGDYTMAFQYVSADGHTLSDTLAFRYEPAAGAEASTGSAAPPECGSTPATASGGEEPSAAPADESAAVLGTVAVIGGVIVLLAVGAGVAVWLSRRRRS
ncbi:copper resistance CopC family protein [Chryseoglobus sp. 28M-23]|uniref:copper resistance CopC family protein n=1 Tax=Chryseoglobus sp. 28M-23 TaxID=2772253 RepID=UPI001747317D|nr:copper resistance CopC family protein [Chryseoglobus sp. 28M-23]QOD92979.1 copper resistance protein CopC [Chryseoglobus sp. 28M-23]